MAPFGFETRQYEGLDGLLGLKELSDGIEKVAVSFSHNGDTKYSERYRGLMNSQSGELVGLVHKTYGLLSHGLVIDTIARELKSRDMKNIHGVWNAWNGGNVMRLGVFFDDLQPLSDGHAELTPGITIRNPYGWQGGGRSFHGEGYYLRSICWNFGILGHLLPELDIMEVHESAIAERVESEFKLFLDQQIAGSRVVERAVSTAMGKIIKYGEKNTIAMSLQVVGVVKKHSELIARKIDSAEGSADGELSYYDIYNAMTQYTTHEKTLTPNVQDEINKIAAKFIQPTYRMPDSAAALVNPLLVVKQKA